MWWPLFCLRSCAILPSTDAYVLPERAISYASIFHYYSNYYLLVLIVIIINNNILLYYNYFIIVWSTIL